MAPTTSPAVIPPRKRQKLTTTACEPCRNRKIRCDGNKPTCEACAKRSQQCVYQATTDVKHVNTYVDSLVQRVSQLEQELENARATILRLSTSPSIPVPPPPQAPLAPPPPHHNIDPRLLPHDERAAIEAGSVDAMGGGDEGNANIDPSFYGSSSDLGFSRQMYGTVLQKDAAPSTSATPRDSASTQQPPILPTRTAPYAAPENFTLLPRELADRLMSLYWDRVHILYPFLHKASFVQAYEDLWKPASEQRQRHKSGLGLGASKEAGPASVIFHCAFNAALALGMQFSDLPLDEKERLSAACLTKSKDLLKLDLFDDCNIALVQTLLLLTQYFQSTNWPSKCWTSIGLACRVAQELGLHIEEDRFEQPFSATDGEMRRRVWHGCVTLDIIVSMTLGRPAMLLGYSNRSLPGPIDGDEEFPIIQRVSGRNLSLIDFFYETVKLYRIVGRILSNIYKINDEQQARPSLVEADKKRVVLLDLHRELAHFSSGLPRGLSWEEEAMQPFHDTTGIPARQAHVLHVRTLHAEILLYRPSFLELCHSYNLNDGSRTSKLTEDDIWPELNCVQSALELIAAVKRYSATKATGAWWYNVFYTRTAGMVVLLSGLCPPILEVIGQGAWEEAWNNCVEILTKTLPQYRPVKTCLTTLSALRQNVIRQRNGHHQRISSSGHSADAQNETNQNTHLDKDIASLQGPLNDYCQSLVDSTFDPFTFVSSDVFTDFGLDFGFDFAQPLI